MATPPVDFPQVADKLKGPVKRSAYEREKAEREAKRRRDEAETAAALAEFEKSMQADDSEDDDKALNTSSAHQRPRYVPAGGKRHYAAAMPNSGPGTLEAFGRKSGPGTLEPLPRKRSYDNALQTPGSHFGLDTEGEMDVEARARAEAHRPAVRVSNLPPQTPIKTVKSLIPEKFGNVEVRIEPPAGPKAGDRKSTAMIITFEVGTPSNEVDNLVSGLGRKYMGWGYYLHASRYLKTPSLNQQLPGSFDIRNRAVQPFGAQPVKGNGPGSVRGNFAPPSSYDRQHNTLQDPRQYKVIVQVPELKQLKMIHKTIEQVVKGGAEFEYYLMHDGDVIHDEKWAFLWDSTSVAGIYYRYRLWDIRSGHCTHNLGISGDPEPVEIFAGSARWVPPKEPPPYEFATSFEDFGTIYDYDPSSDDEFDEEEGGRKFNRSRAPVQNTLVIQEEYLNPLEKARLIWLLAGLPTSTANLVKKDVAAIMDLAISHANRGADEIVDILVTNVERPYCFTSANSDWKKADADLSEHAGLGAQEQELEKSEDAAFDKHGSKKEDDSSAKLIGLYCISDVISAARNANIPGVWRYREMFRKVLLERRVFAKLGRLDRDLGWGRLKAENWKRAINGLLDFWLQCGACLGSEHAELLEDFLNPILTDEEKVAAAKKAKEDAHNKKLADLAKRLSVMKDKAEKKKSLKSHEEPEKGSPDAMDVDQSEPASENVQKSGKPSEDNLKLPIKILALAKAADEVPGETAAARAKRNRVKAEDLFDDPSEDVDMFQFE